MFDPRKKLSVAFIWHMHQPFYKDTLSGAHLMPWVRLHAVKDYYPMAALVDMFDEAAVTFNLVPSLVEQIDDYARHGASDPFLDLSRKKAGSLTAAERGAVITQFFSVNGTRFIETNSRYLELRMKRGAEPLAGAALKRCVAAFSDGDIRDLQVLFNLAWFHSISIDADPALKELVLKREGYTEEDKGYVLERQHDIITRIIPLYRRLAQKGRVELTTTPYYHPILPLLCDTDIARQSMPGADLPARRFRHPGDAARQVADAVRYHTEQFGAPPAGMWPSEGSVSDETLEILMAQGIRWAATDEDILFKSLSSYDRQYHGAVGIDRRVIYRPYRYSRGGRGIDLVFRDKHLSDTISFNYHSWDQDAAARDLIGQCRRVAGSLRRADDRGILTIAMDGENAWEYYPDNGRRFFELLYANLDREDDLCTSGVGAYLGQAAARHELTHIYPGSWINHDFAIWIGKEQDNLSWDYLARVRKDLERFTKELAGAAAARRASLDRAWKEFLIAEGSDWNWWYDGPAHDGSVNPFDRVYRTHLKNVYKALKKPVPKFLEVSINGRRGEPGERGVEAKDFACMK